MRNQETAPSSKLQTFRQRYRVQCTVSHFRLQARFTRALQGFGQDADHKDTHLRLPNQALPYLGEGETHGDKLRTTLIN